MSAESTSPGRTGETVSDRLDRIITEHSNAFYARAVSIVCNRHDAEEVVQEVFSRVCDQPPETNTDEEWVAFIFKVLRNTALNRKRGEKLRRTVSNECDLFPDADEYCTRAEIVELWSQVSQLPPDHQAVLHKRYVESKTLGTIATEMGMSYASVWRLHKAALNTLRKSYQDRHDRRRAIDPRTTAGAMGVMAVSTKSFGWLKASGIAAAVLAAVIAIVGGGIVAGQLHEQQQAVEQAALVQAQLSTSVPWSHVVDETGDTNLGGVLVVGKNGQKLYFENGHLELRVISAERVMLSDGPGWRVNVRLNAEADFHTLKQAGVGGIGWNSEPERLAATVDVTYEGRPTGVHEVSSTVTRGNPATLKMLEEAKKVAAAEVAKALPSEK